MERQKKIIDANIAVKWFSQEENTDLAINLLNQHINEEIQLIVPELLFYEVMNALKCKNQIESELNKTAVELFSFQLETAQMSLSIMNEAIKFSLKYNLTIYDAIYLAIAEIFNAKLITEDKTLINSKHILVETLR